jgi:hypothetical protein
MRSGRGLLAVVMGITAGCSSFGTAPSENDASTGAEKDASVGASSSEAGDAAPVPFCKLSENSKAGTFCDDFDDNPEKPQLLGWSRLEESGARLSYNGIALSAPFAMTATVPKGATFARALAVRKEAPGNRFRVRFHVRGDGPPEPDAPLYIGHVTVNDLYMISMRAFGDGARLRVSLTKLGSPNVPVEGLVVDQAPELTDKAWIPVDVVVDAKMPNYTVTMGERSASGRFPEVFKDKVSLELRMGIEAYEARQASITKDTTLHYDNVVIEADR